MKIVRLWDMLDGWIDITEPISEEEALRLWNKKTDYGRHNTKYEHGDYYRIFDADTKMVYTPEFLGR